MLAKQAKTLTKPQITLLKAFLAQTRYPARNTAMLMGIANNEFGRDGLHKKPASNQANPSPR